MAGQSDTDHTIIKGKWTHTSKCQSKGEQTQVVTCSFSSFSNSTEIYRIKHRLQQHYTFIEAVFDSIHSELWKIHTS